MEREWVTENGKKYSKPLPAKEDVSKCGCFLLQVVHLWEKGKNKAPMTTDLAKVLQELPQYCQMLQVWS